VKEFHLDIITVKLGYGFCKIIEMKRIKQNPLITVGFEVKAEVSEPLSFVYMLITVY
jgi:hypothetical protein